MSYQLHGASATLLLLLPCVSTLPLLGQQIAAEHPSQYVPFLQSSEFLNKLGYTSALEEHEHNIMDLYEELQGADAEEVKQEERDTEEQCESILRVCPWVLDGALYNTRLVDILQKCQTDIARTCPKELKSTRQTRMDKLQQSLLAFGPADTQFDQLLESFTKMPEHCTARSKACQNREFQSILKSATHSRRQKMPMLRDHALSLKKCKTRTMNVVQMAVEAKARSTLTGVRKAFRGVLEWLRFTDRISANEFDGAWTSVNQFLTKGSFEKYARDELALTAEPSPPGSRFPERREKKVSEAKCPNKYKHQMYALTKYVHEKVQLFGSNQILDATFGACVFLNTGKCLQLIAAMSAGKRMDECHLSPDSGAAHQLLETMLPNALEKIAELDSPDQVAPNCDHCVNVGATLEGAFKSIHGGRAAYVNEDHSKVLAFWRSQVDREVPAAVDQHNAIMKALEAAAGSSVEAASDVPCNLYANKDL